MNTRLDYEQPFDWSKYIRDTFFMVWESSTPVDLTDYAFLFEHHFDLNKIKTYLGLMISQAADGEKTERYHKNRIKTLTHIFVESLLDFSDDGKHITNENIEKAKSAMEGESRCIYDC